MDHLTLSLPEPKVVRCFFARQFQPQIPAMELDWDTDSPGLAERTWFFPGRLAIQGPAPTKFGVIIQRRGMDDFGVRLIWNDIGMTWQKLRGVDILTSALAPVLQALGTDLWSVLEQPVDSEGHGVWPMSKEKVPA